MKKLGQHFLIDHAIAKKIADAIKPQTGEVVIEIGPGHGELTRMLLTHAPVVAIERDEALANALKEESLPNLKIIRGNALEELDSAAKHGSYCLAGNIPYYITGHLLRVISELPHRPRRTVLMIQKEVAERIIATPPEMNRLAAAVQFWAVPKILFSVPRNRFSPSPKVDSAVISLETIRRGDIKEAQYYQTLRTLFAQPRKTIMNNLINQEKSRETITKMLAVLDISPSARPQNLSIEQIIALSERLTHNTVDKL